MPVYTYRREDGTTFDVRQKFPDEALQVCPSSGQAVSPGDPASWHHFQRQRLLCQ